ncbi:MAG: helix-turn-helix domain-containing protein, partial [Halieaceae bacterium]
TLNRRLREEGATFRQLKVEAIHYGAKRMLLEGVSVEAIAAIHGYENAANFRRSFRLTNG